MRKKKKKKKKKKKRQEEQAEQINSVLLHMHLHLPKEQLAWVRHL